MSNLNAIDKYYFLIYMVVKRKKNFSFLFARILILLYFFTVINLL